MLDDTSVAAVARTWRRVTMALVGIVSVGIPPEDLRRIPRRLGVAGGEQKFSAIRAALLGGWVNVLITDLGMARRLLEVPAWDLGARAEASRAHAGGDTGYHRGTEPCEARRAAPDVRLGSGLPRRRMTAAYDRRRVLELQW